jgi:hypothetical protein
MLTPNPLLVSRSKIEQSYTSTILKGPCGLWKGETYLLIHFNYSYQESYTEDRRSAFLWYDGIHIYICVYRCVYIYICIPDYTVAIFKYFIDILFLRITFWIRESERLVAASVNPKTSAQVCCIAEFIRSPYFILSLNPVYQSMYFRTIEMMDNAQKVWHKNVVHLSGKTWHLKNWMTPHVPFFGIARCFKIPSPIQMGHYL